MSKALERYPSRRDELAAELARRLQPLVGKKLTERSRRLLKNIVADVLAEAGQCKSMVHISAFMPTDRCELVSGHDGPHESVGLRWENKGTHSNE